MKRSLFFILFLAASYAWAHESAEAPAAVSLSNVPTVHLTAEGSASGPWTNLLFNNDEGSFQFAIVSDRTGGHRAGIFESALSKLNLLQPEFVMSVGDLIEGYTSDRAEIEAEWDEFDSFVQKLQMPFFYLAGNHDMSNPVMADIWKERLGQSYYAFRYQEVLFVVLNSNDGGLHQLQEPQVQWLKQQLAENSDVRWTLVFLHAPLWSRQDKSLWPEVEALLEDRPFTVFAGHNHNYVMDNANGRNYYTLATTGGASGMRGNRFGEFDHVVWVTMRPQGPVIANLMLDGIWPDDISTRNIDNFQQRVLTGAFRCPPILFRKLFIQGETSLRLTNDSDYPCTVHLNLKQIGPVILDTPLPESVEINPNDVVILPLRLHAGADIRETMPVSELSWTMETEIDGQTVSFDGSESVVVARETPLPEAGAPFLDGSLEEWKSFDYRISDAAQIFYGAESWKRQQDASCRWHLTEFDGALYMAIDVTDDELVNDSEQPSWTQDNIQVVIDPRPLALRSKNPAEFSYEYPEGVLDYTFMPHADGSKTVVYDDSGTQSVLIPNDHGYTLEIRVPESLLDSRAQGTWDGVRVNIVLTDKDTDQRNVTSISWQTPWMLDSSTPGTGCFYR